MATCLENPMDRGAWRATVHGVAKESDTTEATWLQQQVYRKSKQKVEFQVTSTPQKFPLLLASKITIIRIL